MSLEEQFGLNNMQKISISQSSKNIFAELIQSLSTDLRASRVLENNISIEKFVFERLYQGMGAMLVSLQLELIHGFYLGQCAKRDKDPDKAIADSFTLMHEYADVLPRLLTQLIAQIED